MTGALTAFGQNAHFTTEGTIEFDKTVNMFALIKKEITKDDTWGASAFEAYKKGQPQFKTYKSTLAFSKDKTLFVPVEPENPPTNGFFSDNPMAEQNNTIFNNLAAGSTIMQKNVFEETFLVKDSTRQIKWKITTETRDIAGYKCRRANAIVMDSIYVVAFYTDEIPVSGGPESFTGLPGMILGVALPHENVTWFATKVNEVAVTPKQLAPPTKGKPVNKKGLFDTLKGATKDWGNYANMYLKGFSL
jgi:GLPGLI family protein